MKLNNNTSLIVGISLPLLMILLVAGSISLPGLFIHPKYGFLYVSSNESVKSPDGFEVIHGSYSNGIFHFTDYQNLYLKGHLLSKKLNLQLNGSYYGNFRFIGWVK